MLKFKQFKQNTHHIHALSGYKTFVLSGQYIYILT